MTRVLVGLALQILDDQLIDESGTRIGRVDDIELEGGPGRELRVASLITGASAWPARLPRSLRKAARVATPGFDHAIPWGCVAEVDYVVKLSRTQTALGLGTEDGRNVRWRGERNESVLLVSDLLGKPLVTNGGRGVGRVREVYAERPDASAEASPGAQTWLVRGMVAGRRGLMLRFASRSAGQVDAARNGPDWVDWDRVAEVRADAVVLQS